MDTPERFSSKLLVFASNEESTPRAESNYRVLKNKHKLEEVSFGEKKFLIVDEKSNNIKSIEEDLQTIEDLDILDDTDYLKALKEQKEKTEKKSLGTCSFCGKKLTTETSLVSSMGPVCEHKAMQIEMGFIPVESYSNFKPFGAMNLKRGDSVVLKTDKNVGFYEFVGQEKGKVNLIDRKKLFVESQRKSPVLALEESLCVVPLEDIRGVCSPSDSQEKKTGPWQDWWSEISKEKK
jgi:hypothetical protein